MTPLANTPSSLGQGARGSSEWSSIQRPAVSLMMRKREKKKQNNMSAQKIFEGSSKSMEASAILKIVEDAFYNCFFIIDVIVRDNASTMQAVLKYPSKGTRGQVLKSPKGKLHTEVPSTPSFQTPPIA